MRKTPEASISKETIRASIFLRDIKDQSKPLLIINDMNYEFQVNILSSKALKSKEYELSAKGVSMDQAGKIVQGFLAMASAICLFVIAGWLIFYVNSWVGLALFLFLAIPFSIRSFFVLKGLTEKESAQTRVRQARSVLMALQGVGFACWFFDVISTIFTININQTGSELNPLGWPFSAVGALAYYIPITFVIYYLLYKIKSKESFYGAVILAAITLFMSARNLNAGLHNFSRIGSFTSSIAELEVLCIWLAIVVALGIFNIIVILRNGA